MRRMPLLWKILLYSSSLLVGLITAMLVYVNHLAGRPALSVLATESGVYHTACVPAVAGGTVFGFVISGSSIDNGFARSLRDVSHNEVVIVGERTLASTLAEARLPWKSRADWES